MTDIDSNPEKFAPYRSRTGIRELKKQLYFSIYSRLSKFIVKRKRKQGISHFTFHDKKFQYLLHPYNLTWNNERTVEVPIVVDFLKTNSFENKKVLEFGSVLRHYIEADWTILDKYEKFPGVENVDIVTYRKKVKYDLVVSISTLEHVGLDDENRPEKILEAIRVLQAALKPGGQAIITVPIGYNKFIDNKIFAADLGFDEQLFLKRVDKDNNWKQVTMDEVKNCEYDYPFYCANAIMIGYYNKPKL